MIIRKQFIFSIVLIAIGYSSNTKTESEYERIIREKREKKVVNATALMNAILSDNWAEVRRLAKIYGPQFLINFDTYILNHKTFPDGFSPLSIAAYRGDLETVKTLVESGASVNFIGTYKSTAFVSAAKREGNIEVVKYLGEHGGYNKFHGAMAANVAADEEIKAYLEDKRIEFLLKYY